MPTKDPPIRLEEIARKWDFYQAHPHRLVQDLSGIAVIDSRPEVTEFRPLAGLPGCRLTIEGSRFRASRGANLVTVGGEDALVLEAAEDRLEVITGLKTADGPVKVTVAGETGEGPIDFTVLPPPEGAAGEDGPPIFFEGAGTGTSAMGLDTLGTSDILVVLCYAQDRIPTDLAGTRTDVINNFDNVDDYYDQISYGRKRLDLDYSDWVALSGNYNDYVDASIDNFDTTNDCGRIVAEAAYWAKDQGFVLDDYDLMTVCLFLDSDRLRALGGWSRQNIAYNGDGLNISITVNHDLELIAIGHNANWGRYAHEIGHNLVTAGAVLGEDVYGSDLISGDNATAELFDIMGSHNIRSCFSGFYMDQLAYYNPGNIIELNWNRNPFEATYDIQEHGDIENADPDRCHLVKINVGQGVFYFIETRRRTAAPLVFDNNIPTGGAAHNGGVIVTKVLTDQVNVNQELRLITLMHDTTVQGTGVTIDDPERALKITVESVEDTDPLTMRVRVAWAQVIEDDVNGTFDLSLTQAGQTWISDDIWVDRQPWGLAPETDDQGHTVATIEKPRPGEVNRLYAQVHNSGPDDTTDVKMTFYAITPPGVGDNGAWAPIAATTITSVPGGTVQEAWVPWTPLVDEHTCLKVHAGHQLGEIAGGNNSAQENVFYFSPPSGSPPEPVIMKIAVRNPRDERTLIRTDVLNVPAGYVVHLPHSWVWVEGKGERVMDFTVIPSKDIGYYLETRKQLRCAIDVIGRIPHPYKEVVEGTGVPAATHWDIGGFTSVVTPKLRGTINIDKDKEIPDGIAIRGVVKPNRSGQQVRVSVEHVGGKSRYATVYTGTNGKFSYRYNPRDMSDKVRMPWQAESSSAMQKGIYAVCAEIINASDLSDAKSNTLYFDLREKKPEKSVVRPKPSAAPPAEDIEDKEVSKQPK